MTDRTHDPGLTSWVEAANRPDTEFPVQNLPFATFCRPPDTVPRLGVGIGDQILDAIALGAASMEDILAMTREERRELRQRISHFLSVYSTGAETLLTPMAEAELLLPCRVGDYTDFYASIHHATNVGSMFRPDNPLMPNYKWLPVGYHGRASSLTVSGTGVRRPCGQIADNPGGPPVYAPTRRLDYELEVGALLGPGNELGESIPIGRAEDHIAGVCLLNDWSARDIQAWEYQPLGPFLAKSFATTLSPWVVTLDALEPFRRPMEPRAPSDPQPLPHLAGDASTFDIRLEVWLRSARMAEPVCISRGQFHLDVLEPRPDGGAPRLQRLQSAAGRPDRQRDGERAGEVKPRVPAGTHLARHRAASVAGRHQAAVPRGWRRSDLSGMVRSARFPAHRLGRMPGYSVARSRDSRNRRSRELVE